VCAFIALQNDAGSLTGKWTALSGFPLLTLVLMNILSASRSKFSVAGKRKDKETRYKVRSLERSDASAKKQQNSLCYLGTIVVASTATQTQIHSSR
jgi:hypothetical protein